MLILSKKKDYYDSSMGIDGIDKTIVYERHEKVFTKHNDNSYIPDEIHKIFYPKSRFWSDYSFYMIKKNDYDFFNIFIIGFCGKYYFGIRFVEIVNNSYDNIQTNIVYDIEEMKNYIENRRGYMKKIKDHTKLNELVTKIKNINTQDTFRKFNTPVFLYQFGDGYSGTPSEYHENFFIVNPCLKKYDFFKIFDSFTCFQEISMYISGVLGNREKDIIQVADKYKIAQHGFDKWSFRKMPENGK